jgi:hypothetical protein
MDAGMHDIQLLEMQLLDEHMHGVHRCQVIV